MSLRPVAHPPDMITPPLTCNASTDPLQHLIDAIKAVWNAIVHVIQSLFSCCRNAEAERVSNWEREPGWETREGELGIISSSEEETSESALISTASSLLHLKVKEANLQLVKDYQRWFLSQRVTTTGSLAAIANTNPGIEGKFAAITLKILDCYPRNYDLFCQRILSDETGPELAEDFASAFHTNYVATLMHTVISRRS